MKKKVFTVELSAVGNPDFDEPPTLKIPMGLVPIKTLAEAQELVEEYITRHNLGGGNWIGGMIRHGTTPFARISYNRRVWGAVDGKEIYLPGNLKMNLEDVFHLKRRLKTGKPKTRVTTRAPMSFFK